MRTDGRLQRNPLVRATVQGLDRFNRRHPWSHNDHYHPWILRRLPGRRRRALDVGCGTGTLLAELSGRFDQVVGVDADAGMADAARSRFAGEPDVSVRHARFDDVTSSSHEAFDLVTMVAVLHHLPLEPALRRARHLLAPGGRLLIIGLARQATPRDLLFGLPSLLLNPVVGMIKHPRPVRDDRPAGAPMPVRDPDETFDQILAAARDVLPGARARRRLFFRYTLEWEKPAGS